MTSFVSTTILQVATMESVYGIEVAPPVWWHTDASEWNAESGTAVTGEYDPALGEMRAPLLIGKQDTYLVGTAGRSGRQVRAVSGNPSSNWEMPYYGTYGVYFPSAALGAAFECVDTGYNSTTGLTPQLVVIRRGLAPVGLTALNQMYCVLELANGDGTNYQVVMQSDIPIRLDYYDGVQLHYGVAQASDIPRTETYFRQHNNEIQLRILPDTDRNIMIVDIGSGDARLKHAPPRPPDLRPHGSAQVLPPQDPNVTTPLPQKELYRFYGVNGWAQYAVLPILPGTLAMKKSKRAQGQILNRIGDAQVLTNATGRDPSTQTTSIAVSQDAQGNLTWEGTAQSLTATGMATLSDVTVYIPAERTQPVVGLPPPQILPPVMATEELEVFDLVTRTFSAQAKFTVDNHSGLYTGNLGNYAYALSSSNGIVAAQRQSGIIAGGFTTFRQDPMRYMQCQGFDLSYLLDKPIGEEVDFDRWCRYSAVHAVLELGQVPEALRQNIPFYPYGRAGYDCPYPILGGGLGNNPRYNYEPDRTAMSILMELAGEAGEEDPITGANIPFMMGQRPDGQWLFEAYDVRSLPLIKTFSSYDPSGIGQILEISVFDSIEDLRTELNFQGQDPYTGEMLYLHLPMPWNLALVGFRYPWTERRGEWCSEAYLNRIAASSLVLGSLPTQSVHMKVYYDPTIHAGQLIYIQDEFALGRGGFFVITVLRSRYGMADLTGRRGERECYQWITAINAEPLIPV